MDAINVISHVKNWNNWEGAVIRFQDHATLNQSFGLNKVIAYEEQSDGSWLEVAIFEPTSQSFPSEHVWPGGTLNWSKTHKFESQIYDLSTDEKTLSISVYQGGTAVPPIWEPVVSTESYAANDFYAEVLHVDGIEHVTLTGNDTIWAEGDDAANELVGNSNDNYLDGGEGADTIFGGDGDDYIHGGSDIDPAAAADSLVGGDGHDTLEGGDGNDILSGGEDDDVLVGGSGADLMSGGQGDDLYVVDNFSDVVVENSGEGTDTVITALHENAGTSSSASISANYGTHGATHFKGEFRNHRAAAALKEDGTVVTWGDASYGGDSSSVSSELVGVTQVFQSYQAFAALREDGSVVTWGDQSKGGDSSSVSSELASDVVHIYSNHSSFAALKSDGSLVTWGSSSGGDSSSVATELSSGVVDVYSNAAGFLAVKDDGSVVPWGASRDTPLTAAMQQELSNGFEKIVATYGSYAAITLNGELLTWGISNQGGVLNTQLVDFLDGKIVTDVVATGTGFGALTSDGDLVYWKDPADPKQPISIAGSADEVVKIVGYEHKLTVLLSDGSVKTWNAGNTTAATEVNPGSGIQDIIKGGASGAFAGLTDTGSVVTWGYSDWGGDSSSVSSELSSGVSEIVSNTRAFAALKDDGSVVTWGDNPYGGDSSTVAEQLSSGVEHLFSGANHFAALKNDGSLVAWGHPDQGGDISAVASQLSSGVVGVSTPTLADDVLIKRFTLPSDVENLEVSDPTQSYELVGNELDNVIRGSDVADTLIGGAGADTLAGGDGGDTYVIQQSSDEVIEDDADSGIDIVHTELSDYSLADGVESLLVNSDADFTGTGNELDNIIHTGAGNDSVQGLAGQDTLISADGDDTLDGGSGADSMVGGKGNDHYVVDDAGDVVVDTMTSISVLNDFSGADAFVDASGNATWQFEGTSGWWNNHNVPIPQGELPSRSPFNSNPGQPAAELGDFLGPVVMGLNTIQTLSTTLDLNGFATTIEFDFYTFDSWDNEDLILSGTNPNGDQVEIFSEVFSFAETGAHRVERSGVDDYGDGFSWTITPVGDLSQLGFANGINALANGNNPTFDAKYRIVLEVPAGIDQFKLVFDDNLDTGSGVFYGQRNWNESWGIDNFSYAIGDQNSFDSVETSIDYVLPSNIETGIVSSQSSNYSIGSVSGYSSGGTIKLTPAPQDGYLNEKNNGGASAAILKDGSVIAWGDPDQGGDISAVADQLNDVKQIYMTQRAFAALKHDGSVVTWGDPQAGGDIHAHPRHNAESISRADQLNSGVVDVYSTAYGFAFHKDDGSVVTLGLNNNFEHDSPGHLSELQEGVVAIASDQYDYRFLKEDGSVLANYGSTINAASSQNSPVVSLMPLRDGRGWAYEKLDGSLILDGRMTHGGSSEIIEIAPGTSGIKSVTPGRTTAIVLFNDGEIFVWDTNRADDGNSISDADILHLNNIGVEAIYGNFENYTAFMSDGTVYSTNTKTDKSDVDLWVDPPAHLNHNDVKQIYTSSYAHAALLNDGSVISWGLTRYGGDYSNITSDLSSGVKQLVPWGYGF